MFYICRAKSVYRVCFDLCAHLSRYCPIAEIVANIIQGFGENDLLHLFCSVCLSGTEQACYLALKLAGVSNLSNSSKKLLSLLGRTLKTNLLIDMAKSLFCIETIQIAMLLEPSYLKASSFYDCTLLVDTLLTLPSDGTLSNDVAAKLCDEIDTLGKSCVKLLQVREAIMINVMFL